MKDFNSYQGASNAEKQKFENSDTMQKVMKIMQSFNGKSEGDLLKAIYKEAEKNRKAGTLTDAELDNFYNMLAPTLDSQKRKKLLSVIKKLKKM